MIYILLTLAAGLLYLLYDLVSGRGTVEVSIPLFPQPSPVPQDASIEYPQGSLSPFDAAANWLSNAVQELGSGGIIPTDPGTWPRGDRLWDVCRAVAFAEGYNVLNSVSARLNNPGDLSDGADQFGFENHSGSRVTTFPDANTGWNWLYNKFSNIVQGRSSVYGQSWTFLQISQKYAGNWQPWVINVTSKLGVTPDTRLIDYVNG